ncbi:hypothetical protein JL09_g6711 [Pichia kudriavzevii]|uniref:Uncharacterized protein n=1 Tax=Pichia kudriavzevii TaxID=4909 RepID=A0A099NL60_PICKU|nr:hypothetical protein JL09_g6711 [Pichia kudriavzevii]
MSSPISSNNLMNFSANSVH